MSVKKLRKGSNRTWKLRQINLVQVILEAHDNDKNTRKRQQCKQISSMFISSGIQTQLISSSGIYKWCLDQLTSDILQVVLMKIASVQEMVIIDKSYEWFHGCSYTWYIQIITLLQVVFTSCVQINLQVISYKWHS